MVARQGSLSNLSKKLSGYDRERYRGLAGHYQQTDPAEDYDLVLVACADSMADVAAYSAHPAHVAAVALVKPVIKARACVDSEK